MEKINIGLVLPSSTILPMGRNFEDGLTDALAGLAGMGVQFTLSKEFIAQGSIKDTENACNKLFNYHDVDIVTGILSQKVVATMADKFATAKKTLIANDLGAHVPELGKLNEYIFINSLNLWQHAWALGNGGVETWGSKGMFIASIYDAGYMFSHMFHRGMMDADANSQWSFSVTPMPLDGELSDMSTIFPYLETYQPDFAFGCFCGTESTKFLNEFIDRGWGERTKLIGLPYLLNPFKPLNGDITIYTTDPFAKNPAINAMNVFYHFGLQTGQAIITALQQGNDRAALNTSMQCNKNLLSVNNSNALNDSVRLVKNSIVAGNAVPITENFKDIVLPGSLQQHMFVDEKDNPIFSWLNPYLCI